MSRLKGEPKHQVKLTITEDELSSFKEYQERHQIEGSLQNAILTAAKIEMNGENLSQNQLILIDKISKIKTALNISDIIHTVGIQEWEVNAIRDACEFLLRYYFPKIEYKDLANVNKMKILTK